MEPSTDHEREIARVVDSLARESNLSSSSISVIIASIKFAMSREEVAFLVRYIQWRIDNPIASEGSNSGPQPPRRGSDRH